VKEDAMIMNNDTGRDIREICRGIF